MIIPKRLGLSLSGGLKSFFLLRIQDLEKREEREVVYTKGTLISLIERTLCKNFFQDFLLSNFFFKTSALLLMLPFLYRILTDFKMFHIRIVDVELDER